MRGQRRATHSRHTPLRQYRHAYGRDDLYARALHLLWPISSSESQKEDRHSGCSLETDMEPALAFSQPGTQNVEMLRLLLSNPLFRTLGERLKPLSMMCCTRTIQVGDPLFRVGHSAEQVWLVLSGLLKVIQHTEDGSEVILGIFGAGELVGLLAALQRQPHKTTAVALSKQVRILSIPSIPFMAFVNQAPESILALNQTLMQQIQLLDDTIDVLSAGSVPQRLAALLLTLTERFGDEMEDGSTLVPVTLSRGELSSLINTRSETTIRMLTRWRKQGIVETSREGFVIQDPRKLEEILHGECA